MISILHGDDEVKILNELSARLQHWRSKQVQIVQLDAKGLTIPDLENAVGTQELFISEKAVIIHKLYGLSKGKLKDELTSWLSEKTRTIDSSISVILVENKIVTPTQLKQFPHADVQIFKLPAMLFSFVDSIGLISPARLVTQFHSLLETQDAEFVFAMLIRQIRMLIAYVSDGSYSGSPFGRTKIAKQSQKFTLPKLITLHDSLLLIDSRQKTSRASLSLVQEIDLFLNEF